jgi:hypothetical protein
VAVADHVAAPVTGFWRKVVYYLGGGLSHRRPKPCLRCGCPVLDWPLHERWHARIDPDPELGQDDTMPPLRGSLPLCASAETPHGQDATAPDPAEPPSSNSRPPHLRLIWTHRT